MASVGVVGGGGGGGGVCDGVPYPEGRSLALYFIDERESKKPTGGLGCAETRERMVVSLARCGYEILEFNGGDILGDTRRALADANPATLSRVALLYDVRLRAAPSRSRPRAMSCPQRARGPPYSLRAIF